MSSLDNKVINVLDVCFFTEAYMVGYLPYNPLYSRNTKAYWLLVGNLQFLLDGHGGIYLYIYSVH